MRLSPPIRILVVAISVIAGVAALFAWGWMVVNTLDVRVTLAQALSDRDAARARAAYSGTVRSLMRDTGGQRAVLESFATQSPIEIVDVVEAAADDAGVVVSIDAVEERIIDVPPVKKVPAFAVTLSGSGAFNRLYRFASLLSDVPLPAVLDHVSLESGGANGTWSLRARLIVFSEAAQ